MKKEKIHNNIRRFKFEKMRMVADHFINDFMDNFNSSEEEDEEVTYYYEDLKENVLYASNMKTFFGCLKYELSRVEDLSEMHFYKILNEFVSNFYDLPTCILIRIKKLISDRFNVTAFNPVFNGKYL